MISYAQAREDVLLHRALRSVEPTDGFYIDVGAYHPFLDSVTQHFYGLGWHGINVEPSPSLFAPFADQRVRDVNLQVAVTDHTGEVAFHEVEGQLSTLESKFANRHSEAGLATRTYTVSATTLRDICSRHTEGREIHFLKIDVEGHEAAVLRGMDFQRFRPWILVIEATEPNNLAAPTFQEWDADVRAAGYRFAYTDVLNRYYVADEHAELLPHFAVGPDEYDRATVLTHLGAWRNRALIAEERLAVLESAGTDSPHS
jgi:FkbM family methyltransferase